MPRLRFIRAIGGVAAALLALAGCRQAEPMSNDDRSNRSETVANSAVVPQEPDIVGRAALLTAIAEAASAFAAGADDRAAQESLDGRAFRIVMPFACQGVPPVAGGTLSLSLRPGGRSYEVRAAPTIDLAAAGVAPEGEAGAPSPIQSVEGFWFRRPWLLADACPAARGDVVVDPAMTMTAPEKVVATDDRSAGIARYVAEGESRLANRSGRDYRKVVTLKEGEAPPKGLYLLLEGRLRKWPGGKVITCRDGENGARPSCIAAAAIDRVAIERIDDRSVLAEWTNS